MTMDSISTRILHLIKVNQIVQADLAKACGVSRAAVSKWVKGGSIEESNVDKIASFFSVTPNWLRYGETAFSVADNTDEKSIESIIINPDAAQIVSWEWDVTHNTVSYSDNVKEVYGIDIHCNDDFFSLLKPSDKEEVNRIYERLIQFGGSTEMDFQIQVNNESKWITSRATGITEDDLIKKIVGISMDNTMRVEAEYKASRYQTLFFFILDKHPHAVFITSKNGEFIHCNLKAANQDYLEQKLRFESLIANHFKSVVSQFERSPADEHTMIWDGTNAVITQCDGLFVFYFET
ncbi:XRE family transcriptional regulator [Vibrio tapetis subsp. tapetis]|uniref:XRE family transcriptional regulator n=2 Tax=Vibrio tapetis TaxID=52443 RepID=A0A2N8ZHD4_9VIBR|nr:XRE family transcriptional regulator [Vibrio tapetis subsp. tapetis]